MIIEFDYDGHHRVVEPYYYGLTAKDNPAVRGYQTNWGGVRSQDPDWHIFVTEKIERLQVSTRRFDENRAEYNPDDTQMHGYYARV